MVFSITRTVKSLWRQLNGADEAANAPSDDPNYFPGGDMPSTVPPSGSHSITYEDICQARAILQSLKLPMELVLEILDFAEYRPWQQWTMKTRMTSTASAFYGETNESAVLCLNAGVLSVPFVKAFGEETPRIRDITWTFTSHDQGWTSEGTTGTFETSSWLDVSIIRPDPNSLPIAHLVARELPGTGTGWSCISEYLDIIGTRGWKVVRHQISAGDGQDDVRNEDAWKLQSNRVASRTGEEYQVGCRSSANGFEGNEGAGDGIDFLKTIQPGDRVLVWARAKYPGWVCYVESLQMTINYNL